jgi:two-component sensor histidine kinase
MAATIYNKITQIGIHSGLSTYERKIRIFFNQISIIGGIFMLLQAIFFAVAIDPLLGLYMFIGPIGSALGLYLHKIDKFLTARIISYSMVMIGGGIASVLIGKDHAFHLGSLTVIFANVICFSKKEFWYSLIPIMVAAILIILTESNHFKIHYPNLPEPENFRLGTIFGTLVFVLFELYFITGMSEASENVVETKLKKVKNTVEIQNEELTLMMREIHHRVKNNLQIIISLLRLRSHDLDDEKSKDLFESTIDRIQSMSILHQKIYMSKNISKFNMQEYLEALTDNLIQSYSVEKNIQLEIKSDIDEIDNDFVVSFALILNELISNSLKHAFNDKNDGLIIIEALKKEDQFILNYSDNGKWIESEKEESFGLELIDLLTEQISGSYSIDKTPNSTVYNFTF